MSLKPRRRVRLSIPAGAVVIFAGLCALGVMAFAFSQKDSVKSLQTVKDPGPRTGTNCVPCAGTALSGLSTTQTTAFNDGQSSFNATFNVPAPLNTNPTTGGLGPAFNSNSCESCHMQPAAGGGSAYDTTGGTVSQNPLYGVYQLDGATNTMPSFEISNGPEVIARFPYMLNNLTVPDGSIHQLFTIKGRTDAPKGCNLAQPNFAQALSDNDIVSRQPIETFGDGLIEIIENISIINQANAECANQSQTGVCGIVSVDEHTGDVNRLGWKAQWRGLQMAAAEELNTELGVTNEFFPAETNQTVPACLSNPVPESSTNFNSTIQFDQFTGDSQRMGVFMSFLAPPTQANFNSAASNGQTQFQLAGCTNCHSYKTYTTPAAGMGSFMSNKTLTLYSDLLLHHMGNCLADNIVQGSAQGDMWRTPPLWGTGLRIFFMHDGRAPDLLTAIEDHVVNWNPATGTGTPCSGLYQASEATNAVNAFNGLSTTNQQDILDFLRDL